MRRLFIWLKDRGITAVITGERGAGTLDAARHRGVRADCVIVLDHRVIEQTSTRRLRILKYRGSLHGTNEYPFLIGDSGVSVLPVTSAGPAHKVSTERVSTGVARLDSMLSDGGFYKGSTVLDQRHRGTGKSTLAAQFCDATCRGGKRAIYFAFEESEGQIVRNMGSVGIDLQQWVDAGLLQFRCSRPSLLGLEAHLFAIQQFVGEFDPAVVVMDPVSDLLRIGSGDDVSAHAHAPGRLPEGPGRDHAVHQPRLRAGSGAADEQITSLVDTALLVKTMEGNGELNRVLYVLEVARDGPLEPDPRVPAHRPGDRVGRRLRRAAGRAHRLRAPGPGGPGALGRHSAAGEPRAAPSRAGDAARGGRGTDRRAVAGVRGRGRRRRPAPEPCVDWGRGPGWSACRAGRLAGPMRTSPSTCPRTARHDAL